MCQSSFWKGQAMCLRLFLDTTRLCSVFSWLCLYCLAANLAAQQPASAANPPPANQPQAKTLDQADLLRRLHGDDPPSAREAAAAIQMAAPTNRDDLLALADAVKSALSTTRDAKAEAALRLALGKL